MDYLANIRTGSAAKAAAAVPAWAPTGSRGTSLADQVMAQQTAAAPAQGSRPDPGPVPGGTAKKDDAVDTPLRFQFPYAVNQFVTPRGQSRTAFSTLRLFADVCDIVRICIETRKDQICSLKWDVALRDSKGKPDGALKTKIDDARAFLFGKPDRRRSFDTWLRMAIEEILVIDALAIYRRRTNGGDLYALEIKDGSTFQPLLDETGDTPTEEFVAYRQIINGQPVQGGDCTIRDLLYRPRTVRTHTPYGLSPTEAILITINSALNRQVFNLQYYAEGNVPEGLISAPASWSPQQIADFQKYFDSLMAGDLAMRRRLRIVGQGMTEHVYQFKEPSFDTKFDEWLLKVACAAFAVPPQEIGFTGDVNKATGAMQENVVYRRGVKPLAGFLKGILDEVLAEDLDCGELEAVFSGGEPEDLLVKAQADQVYVNMAKVSVDDLRVRDGQEPIGLGPYLMTPTGPVFVEELINGVDDDPDTTDLDPNTPLDQQPNVDPNPDPDDPAAAAPKDQSPDEDQVGDELKKWRKVAIACAKKGQPVRKFRTEHVPAALAGKIEKALEAAGDVGTVVAVFQRVEKARTTAAKIRKAERSLHTKTADFFTAQGKALADFLRDGIKELA